LAIRLDFPSGRKSGSEATSLMSHQIAPCPNEFADGLSANGPAPAFGVGTAVNPFMISTPSGCDSTIGVAFPHDERLRVALSGAQYLEWLCAGDIGTGTASLPLSRSPLPPAPLRNEGTQVVGPFFANICNLMLFEFAFRSYKTPAGKLSLSAQLLVVAELEQLIDICKSRFGVASSFAGHTYGTGHLASFGRHLSADGRCGRELAVVLPR